MASPLTVLVVDAERPLVGVLATHLAAEDFTVHEAYDAAEGVEAARVHRPDVIIIDLDLPDRPGVTTLHRLRDFTDAYIIVLTATDDETAKVLALNDGADDYVLKPFSARELIARIGAMTRRPRLPGPGGDRPVWLGDLRIDAGARSVHQGHHDVGLTRTEFDLLLALATRPGRALPRRQLLEEVWGPEWFGDEQVVDVHIGHLRRKLGDPATHPRYVRTVRGVGYSAVPT